MRERQIRRPQEHRVRHVVCHRSAIRGPRSVQGTRIATGFLTFPLTLQQESQDNTFVVQDFEPETARRMLEYMYTGKYSLPDMISANTLLDGTYSPGSGDVDSIATVVNCHAEMYAIGDFYLVKSLKDYAQINMWNTLREHRSGPVFFALAKRNWPEVAQPEVERMLAKAVAPMLHIFITDPSFNWLEVSSTLMHQLLLHSANQINNLNNSIIGDRDRYARQLRQSQQQPQMGVRCSLCNVMFYFTIDEDHFITTEGSRWPVRSDCCDVESIIRMSLVE